MWHSTLCLFLSPLPTWYVKSFVNSMKQGSFLGRQTSCYVVEIKFHLSFRLRYQSWYVLLISNHVIVNYMQQKHKCLLCLIMGSRCGNTLTLPSVECGINISYCPTIQPFIVPTTIHLIVYDCYLTSLWSGKPPTFLTANWMSKNKHS